MERVQQWLEGLGLGQYGELFMQNAITFELLPDLDSEVLKEIGVSAAGHRMLILKAVRALAAAPAAQVSVPPTQHVGTNSAPTSTPLSVPPATGGREAERRQITVMFCDLVGSTELSQALDPEDLRDVIGRYQKAAGGVIEGYEGHVAQYLGDGLMVYFGWPRAHGDEARRAVRAGLEIIQAVRQLDAPVSLAVRVGIATGVVVIGQTGDGDASQPRTAVGETPNIAARLQGLAQPNEVVIGPVTKSLAREAFEFRDLGTQLLKGIGEPVHAWGVVAVRAEDSEQTTQAIHGTHLLVGRDEELGLLRRAWLQSKEGRGQVVLINGEPGIGKSTLVHTLLAQLRVEGVPRVTVHCSAYHTNSAFHPVIEHIKKVIGWEDEQAPAVNVERLERRLNVDGLPLDEFIPPLASLLSLQIPPERYRPLELSAQELKQRILDCLVEWQLQEAARQPIVWVWEDLHWVDPSSLECVSLLIDQVPTAPLLLVLTLRPEFVPPWITRSHMTPITLNRLERPQIEAMVSSLAKGKALPEEVLEHIVRKTDGVPLYVEELTKTILVSNVLREAPERYELTGPLSAVAIPATLQESLMARLDRLPTVRQVAQLGAVLGREFAYEMLQALGIGDESTLIEGLSQLVADELLHQRGRLPRAKYIFKHALIQDAAYQSLLKRTRQQYHRQVAQLLEARFPEQVETQPELLAYHYAGAGMAREAIDYWRKAAKRSASRSAYREAIAHFDEAVTALAALPQTKETNELAVDLRFEFRNALHPVGEFDRVLAILQDAKAIASQLNDQRRLGRIDSYLAQSFRLMGDLERAIQAGEHAVEIGQGTGDLATQVTSNFHLGQTYFALGVHDRAIEMHKRNIDMLPGELALHLHGMAGLPAVFSRGHFAWSLAELGRFDEAIAAWEEALRIADAGKHGYSQAFAEYVGGFLYLRKGDIPTAVSQLEHGLERCKAMKFRLELPFVFAFLGTAYTLSGREREGIPLIEQGVELAISTKVIANRSWLFSLLAAAYLGAGRTDEAQEWAAQAFELSHRYGEQGWEAWALYTQGNIHAHRTPLHPDKAFETYAAASSRAEALKLRPLLARCALSLGRLYERIGDKDKARRHLLVAVTSMRELDMQFWYRQAQQQLASVDA